MSNNYTAKEMNSLMKEMAFKEGILSNSDMMLFQNGGYSMTNSGITNGSMLDQSGLNQSRYRTRGSTRKHSGSKPSYTDNQVWMLRQRNRELQQ